MITFKKNKLVPRIISGTKANLATRTMALSFGGILITAYPIHLPFKIFEKIKDITIKKEPSIIKEGIRYYHETLKLCFYTGIKGKFPESYD